MDNRGSRILAISIAAAFAAAPLFASAQASGADKIMVLEQKLERSRQLSEHPSAKAHQPEKVKPPVVAVPASSK